MEGRLRFLEFVGRIDYCQSYPTSDRYLRRLSKKGSDVLWFEQAKTTDFMVWALQV
jgi:hypothetical protein